MTTPPTSHTTDPAVPGDTADTPATPTAYREAVDALSATAARDALITMYTVRDRMAADRDDLAATLEIRTAERDEARADRGALLGSLAAARAEALELRAARTQRDEALAELERARAALAAERLLSEGRLRRVRERDAEIARLTGELKQARHQAAVRADTIRRIHNANGIVADDQLRSRIRNLIAAGRDAIDAGPGSPSRAQDAPVGSPTDTPDAVLVAPCVLGPTRPAADITGDIPEPRVLAVLEQLGWPDDRAASAHVEPDGWQLSPAGHYYSLAEDVVRAADAAAAPAGEPTPALPAGTPEHRTEWAVQWPGLDMDLTDLRAKPEAHARAEAQTLGTVLHSRTVTTWPDGSTLITPWVPAADGDTPAPASTCPSCKRPYGQPVEPGGRLCRGCARPLPAGTTPAPAFPSHMGPGGANNPHPEHVGQTCDEYDATRTPAPAEPAGTDTGGQQQ